MYSAKIKALNDEYIELIEFCRLNNQVSFEMYINDTYKNRCCCLPQVILKLQLQKQSMTLWIENRGKTQKL